MMNEKVSRKAYAHTPTHTESVVKGQGCATALKPPAPQFKTGRATPEPIYNNNLIIMQMIIACRDGM